VTGGAGFIGSNLVDDLLANGAAFVRVLDNLTSGKLSNLEEAQRVGGPGRFEFMKGDIRNPKDCEKACATMDIVFHEAAFVSVAASMIDPVLNNNINITGTLNMLKAAAAAGVKRFVFASSAATYGDDPRVPKREDMERHYPSPYALSKGVDEDYAKLWAYVKGDGSTLGAGMTCVGLRYFNVFGPRQDPTSYYSGVISKFTSLMNEGKGVTVFGDGKQTRDFVFVKDVVQANLLAGLATLTEGQTARVFNVGTGVSTDLLTLVATIDKILGRTNSPTPVDKQPPRAGNIRDSLSSIDRIRAEMGYVPRYSLEDGLRILLDFLKANPGTAQPSAASANLDKGDLSDFQHISSDLFTTNIYKRNGAANLAAMSTNVFE
jgi:nucleoside-diphosphate-sugar epimerase